MKDTIKGLSLIGGIIAGILLIVTLIVGPFTIVHAGERGVVLNWGAFQGEVLEPGFHFVTPIKQKVKKINVQASTVQVDKSEAYSKDLQMVNIQSSFTYNVDPAKVGEYFQDYKGETDGLLNPRLEPAIKEIVAQYSAEEILSKRGEIQKEIGERFAATIPNVFLMTNYSLMDESFTPEYEAAIEAKQIAQQNAEKAKNDLERIKVEAEQTTTKSIADAEAIRIQSEALANNQDYVQLKALDVQSKALDKWNGILPTTMLGDSVPFINIKDGSK